MMPGTQAAEGGSLQNCYRRFESGPGIQEYFWNNLRTILQSAGVAELAYAPVLGTGRVQALGGSNPSTGTKFWRRRETG